MWRSYLINIASTCSAASTLPAPTTQIWLQTASAGAETFHDEQDSQDGSGAEDGILPSGIRQITREGTAVLE